MTREPSPSGEANGVPGTATALWRWLLLDGDRRLIASAVLATVFLAVLGAGLAGALVIRRPGPVSTLVASLIGGTLPFITVVLAINQLILTTEFGSTGTFRDRLEETREFRKQVEGDVGTALSPTGPAQFMRGILLAIRQDAASMSARAAEAASAGATADPPGRVADAERWPAALERFATDLGETVDAAIDRLEGARFGTFEVLAVALDFDDAHHRYQLRRLRLDHGEDLPSAVGAHLDSADDLLADSHVARLYFKTVHVQQELADLSRWLMYAGALALAAGGAVVLGYGRLLAGDPSRLALAAAVAASFALAVAPFAILLAYVLRIAVVARRTAADFGPFDLRRDIPAEAVETDFYRRGGN